MAAAIEDRIAALRLYYVEVFVQSQAVHASVCFGSLIGYSTFGDDFDLFQLSSIKAKEFRHLNNLSWTDEVSGIGAEFFDPRLKLATPHGLGQVQA